MSKPPIVFIVSNLSVVVVEERYVYKTKPSRSKGSIHFTTRKQWILDMLKDCNRNNCFLCLVGKWKCMNITDNVWVVRTNWIHNLIRHSVREWQYPVVFWIVSIIPFRIDSQPSTDIYNGPLLRKDACYYSFKKGVVRSGHTGMVAVNM
jgi:hypothetical protein